MQRGLSWQDTVLSGHQEEWVKSRDKVRAEPDAWVSVRPLRIEREEVKPTPVDSGSLVCLPGSLPSGSLSGNAFPTGLLLIL